MFRPSFEIPVPEKVDFSLLEYPEELFAERANLVMNQMYEDMRGWYGWDAVRSFYGEEKDILLRAFENAGAHDAFEEYLIGVEESYESSVVYDGPAELGIATVVSALIAGGYVTADSCRGHPMGCTANLNNFPNVFLFAKDSEARLLDDLVEDSSGVHLMNAHGDAMGLALYSYDNLVLLDFAKKMADYFAPE